MYSRPTNGPTASRLRVQLSRRGGVSPSNLAASPVGRRGRGVGGTAVATAVPQKQHRMQVTAIDRQHTALPSPSAATAQSPTGHISTSPIKTARPLRRSKPGDDHFAAGGTGQSRRHGRGQAAAAASPSGRWAGSSSGSRRRTTMSATSGSLGGSGSNSAPSLGLAAASTATTAAATATTPKNSSSTGTRHRLRTSGTAHSHASTSSPTSGPRGRGGGGGHGGGHGGGKGSSVVTSPVSGELRRPGRSRPRPRAQLKRAGSDGVATLQGRRGRGPSAALQPIGTTERRRSQHSMLPAGVDITKSSSDEEADEGASAALCGSTAPSSEVLSPFRHSQSRQPFYRLMMQPRRRNRATLERPQSSTGASSRPPTHRGTGVTGASSPPVAAIPHDHRDYRARPQSSSGYKASQRLPSPTPIDTGVGPATTSDDGARTNTALAAPMRRRSSPSHALGGGSHRDRPAYNSNVFADGVASGTPMPGAAASGGADDGTLAAATSAAATPPSSSAPRPSRRMSRLASGPGGTAGDAASSTRGIATTANSTTANSSGVVAVPPTVNTEPPLRPGDPFGRARVANSSRSPGNRQAAHPKVVVAGDPFADDRAQSAPWNHSGPNHSDAGGGAGGGAGGRGAVVAADASLSVGGPPRSGGGDEYFLTGIDPHMTSPYGQVVPPVTDSSPRHAGGAGAGRRATRRKPRHRSVLPTRSIVPGQASPVILPQQDGPQEAAGVVFERLSASPPSTVNEQAPESPTRRGRRQTTPALSPSRHNSHSAVTKLLMAGAASPPTEVDSVTRTGNEPGVAGSPSEGASHTAPSSRVPAPSSLHHPSPAGGRLRRAATASGSRPSTGSPLRQSADTDFSPRLRSPNLLAMRRVERSRTASLATRTPGAGGGASRSSARMLSTLVLDVEQLDGATTARSTRSVPTHPPPLSYPEPTPRQLVGSSPLTTATPRKEATGATAEHSRRDADSTAEGVGGGEESRASDSGTPPVSTPNSSAKESLGRTRSGRTILRHGSSRRQGSRRRGKGKGTKRHGTSSSGSRLETALGQLQSESPSDSASVDSGCSMSSVMATVDFAPLETANRPRRIRVRTSSTDSDEDSARPSKPQRRPLAALKSPLVLDDLSGWVTPQVDTTGDQPTVFDAGVLLSSTPSARHLKVKARRSSNFSIPGSPSSMASTPTAASPSRDGRNETRGQTSTSRGASDGQTRRRQSDGSAGADDDDNDDSDSHSDGSAASQQSRDSPT